MAFAERIASWFRKRRTRPEAGPPRRRRHRILLASLASLVTVIVLIVAFWDWNAFRGMVARAIGARLHRDVVIAGDLKVTLFSWTPHASLADIRIAQPDWAPKTAPFATIDRFAIALDLKSLFGGHIVLPEVTVEKPKLDLLRTKDDKRNWDFSAGNDSSEPWRLPPIRHFAIVDGGLVLADARRELTFKGGVSSEETAGGNNNIFHLQGEGELNRQPFTLEVQGDPLLNVAPEKPYGFNAKIRAGATKIDADGRIEHPFDFGHLAMDVDASGPTLADLYYLIGIALPNTRAYRLTGTLIRDDNQWHLAGIDGTVGQSDLKGSADVDASHSRLYLKADLASKKLDFVDLGPLIGATPVSSGKGAAAAKGRAPQPAMRVLPDAPLKVERLRQFDADVKYVAETVASKDFPLRGADVTLSLKDGVLKLTPTTFKFAQGTLSGNIQIDARRMVPVSDVDVRLTGLRMEQFLPASKTPALEGTALARLKLHGAGDSIRKAAAAASGAVTVVVPHGAMRRTFAELLGINVATSLGLILTGDTSQAELRCAVADFQAKNGVLSLGQFVFDTETVGVTAKGSLDLRDEHLDLELTGHPKKPELLRVRAPVTISGPIVKPSIGIKPATAILQGGLAVGLATVLSPLAAILPFVDAGLTEDANCGAYLAAAKTRGAPVSNGAAAAATPAPKPSTKRKSEAEIEAPANSNPSSSSASITPGRGGAGAPVVRN